MNKKNYAKGTEVAFKNNSEAGCGAKIIAQHWDFGDGGVSEEENPVHFYKEQGTYPIKLIVEDNLGQKDLHTHTLKITMLNEGLLLREMCMGKTEEEYEEMEKILDNFLDEIGAGRHMLEWKWGQLDENKKQYYTEKYPEVISAMVALKLGSSE